MLKKLVFSVTYDCPISCKYCVTRSGPHNGPFLDAEFMKEAISVVHNEVGLRSVIFTGGEPLYRSEDVEEAIRFAHSLGLWTRVVTNAFWAKNPAAAEEVIKRLKKAGLSEINFSCDDLHQEHIPLENIHNAFWAAKKATMPVLLAHKRVVNMRITPEYLSKFLGVELKEFKENEDQQDGENLYSSSFTVPIGQGSDKLDESKYIIYPTSPYGWTSPCCGVLDGLIISPEKELKLCCGMMEQTVPELTFGKWDSDNLCEILINVNSDLIANWLSLEGPYGIMKFIQEKDPQIKFKSSYVNHCHLCNEIFTRSESRAVLSQYAAEKATALGLRRGLLEALRHEDRQQEKTKPQNCSKLAKGN